MTLEVLPCRQLIGCYPRLVYKQLSYLRSETPSQPLFTLYCPNPSLFLPESWCVGHDIFLGHIV